MRDSSISRRGLLGGTIAAASLGAWCAKAQPLKAAIPLTVVDAAGDLTLSEHAFEAFRQTRPELVSKITFTRVSVPELPAKLQNQRATGHIQMDLVLADTDALSAGIEQALWLDVVGAYGSVLPPLDDILEPTAARMQRLAKGQGVIVACHPTGPLLEYMPDRVTDVPETAEDLLAWSKAHANRFLYARPASSGPGQAFLMGLPYILGDADPEDPRAGWDKTWAYLAELDRTIDFYPRGTGTTMRDLRDGRRDIVASTIGWDISPRAFGVVPGPAEIATIRGFHFVADGHFMCVPKGLPRNREAVVIALMTYLLSKPAQAFLYDEGYFYPGPVVKDVPLSMAPETSQTALREFGRPEYDELIADTPIELPLAPDRQAAAYRRWDETIGSRKVK
jgi:putative spermidine/putrescine transport system substrate-binding protein